jgi:cephalosporin hydroxylase
MLQGYNQRCQQISDINEHLPVLYDYAKKCSSVVECGVRTIVSSYAFALGLKNTSGNKLTMVDPSGSPSMPGFLKLCESEGVNAQFWNQSDLECPLIQTDLLFIDTWHVYGQLKRELARWHSSVNKYIIMHDTTVDEWYGETIRIGWNAEQQSKQYGIAVDEIKKGLWPAIEEFLTSHPEWVIEKRLRNNNGLTILKRK